MGRRQEKLEKNTSCYTTFLKIPFKNRNQCKTNNNQHFILFNRNIKFMLDKY